ncbi:hypothetical protein [Natronoglycomyces albus]|uniref:Uncharacterized protein n=1 Tax=Natronoglycomyces albus TaxID=2811108 RepID=A0A895XNC5_9ACTN|nr:hypothetical protein [Natronoglycomyces albus]QSB05282.1 hypothetical protein JQS30_16265 [Natronoglycomyces albus]
MTFVQSLTRTALATEHQGCEYLVAADFLGWDKSLALYRDRQLVEQRDFSGKFTLDDGARISVKLSLFGVKQANLKVNGVKTALKPTPDTIEYKRLRWNQKHPKRARWIGFASWMTLVAAVVVGLPQLAEQIGQIDALRDWGYSFTSPLHLPAALNTALGTAAMVAAIERATRMKYSWLDEWA